MTLPPEKKPLVDLLGAVPDAVLDIRYAGPDNVFKTALYPFPAAYLRPEAAERLARAAETLRRRGLRLRIFDAYRPLSVQRLMWALKPDARYVADPAKGSAHNRGAAVDAGLASPRGEPLEMPSDFDDFSARAAHDHPGAPPKAAGRAAALRAAMEEAGFASLSEEWWHYSDPGLSGAPLLDIPWEDLR